MKKLILTVTAMASLCFASCGSDDSDNQDPVVGKWQQIAITDGLDVTACVFNETLEFTNDGKLVLTQFESSTPNDTDNCDMATTINYEWSTSATNTYDITLGSKTYGVFISTSGGELKIRTSELFVPENVESSQITKTYKPI